MTNWEIISIVAIVVWPVMAVWITLMYQYRRERKQSKLDVFHTLISHRWEIPIPRNFVAALNKIVVVFCRHRKVLTAWKEYFENLKWVWPIWNRDNLFANLLDEMAFVCGYKWLKQTVYLDSYVPNQYQYESTRSDEFHTELMKFLRAHQNVEQPIIVQWETIG